MLSAIFLVQETVMNLASNFLCKFLVTVSVISFWYQFLLRVSLALSSTAVSCGVQWRETLIGLMLMM